MQAVQHQAFTARSDLMLPILPSPLTPAVMAHYLRRTNGDAAYCFARVMYEESAWANQDWGNYWASVMQLVEPAQSPRPTPQA